VKNRKTSTILFRLLLYLILPQTDLKNAMHTSEHKSFLLARKKEKKITKTANK